MLHRCVAEILRERFPDTAAFEPEVLPHHFTQAALTDAAIECWGNAGEQAPRRSYDTLAGEAKLRGRIVEIV